MNIYEQEVFNLIHIKKDILTKEEVSKDPTLLYEFDKIEKNNGEFHIFQNRNFDYRQYKRYFLETKSISKVEVIKGNSISEIQLDKNGATQILIDFDDKIDAMKFYVRNNLVDPFIVPFKYIEGDKEHYKMVSDSIQREQYIENMAISKSTGNNLINVYFQPCCKQYHSTRIDFYVKRDEEYIFLQSYEIENKIYWLSISGLAPNYYGFIVNQYDKNNNTLVSSDLIEVQIKKPINSKLGHRVG